MECKYFVYVLVSDKDGNHYVGMSKDIENRLKEHNAGKVTTTKSRRPLRLIYFEEHPNRIEARAQEKFLKTGKGRAYLRDKLNN